MNHLASESSPYLLQHRDNPVDWYPWGEEAFKKATDEDRPIFLSIGYATCHWCHVMEHESFADNDVASLMNETFVSIKVDREERPDIDNIYMTVCQLMGGHCGWPLNVVLTPDRKPFFVATYIPRTSRHGRIGMVDLVPRIAQAWRARRDDILGTADEVTSALRSVSDGPQGEARLDADWLKIARDQFGERYDPIRGGFGQAPKFPSPHNLVFLLRYGHRKSDQEVIGWVTHTLKAMRMGGVFDQIGHGFHRYSTDAEWKLPHFEKMLYDQALHVLAYSEAFAATGDALFGQTALQVSEYVLRDLTSEDGAFFSAEDADSEGVEGKFYVWSIDEVRELLEDDVAERVIALLNMKPEGNFHDEATRQLTGENVPYLDVSDPAFAMATEPELEDARKTLFRRREGRVRPLLDDKVLADWNGLMIGALAYAGRVMGQTRLIDAASRAARFVRETMVDPAVGLMHRYRDGIVGIPGLLDDYVFMAWGMTELYQATLDTEHLVWALQLTEKSLDRFWDEEHGGFYIASPDRTDLLVRAKDFNDGAIPSGNAVGLMNLVRLGRICGRTDLDDRASTLLEVAAPTVVRFSSAFSGLLLGLEFLQSPSETVLAGPRDDATIQSMREALGRAYLPGNVVVGFAPDDPEIKRAAPYVANYSRGPEGAPLAYVCRNYVCAEPAGSKEEMMRRFSELPGGVMSTI